MPEPEVEESPSVRSFWSGTITFGLVSIPVDLFPALRSRDIALRLVDEEGNAVGREYYCPEHGAPVGAEELVRGHEDEEGRMLEVSDEELEGIAPEMSRDIDLRRFVPKEQISPAYYERPYYLAPAGRSTKAYHLLAETMERTGRAGIGTFVMRGHEYLVAILAEGGLLRAETLRFADELRSPEALGLPKRRPAPKERVSALEKAIAKLAAKELPMEVLSDDRAERLHRLVEGKLKRGEDVITPEAPAEDDQEEQGGQVLDLMQILQERISGQAGKAPAKSKAGRSDEAPAKPKAPASRKPPARGGRKGPRARDTSDELRALSKDDLYARATRLDIAGRSTMSKPQLIAAIQRAS